MVFRSLKNYNFRLFFFGQLISLSGTWVQQLAVSWLAYRLTQSAVWLGIVSFFSMIPVFLFGFLAGPVIDRTNRRQLLILTQTLAMIQAFVLAYFTLKGTLDIYSLLVFSIFLGIINSFDIPVRQAFVIDLVERDHLHNAIALNSAGFNFSRMLGPVLAGFIVAKAGEGVCFVINGFSFLAAIISLFLLKGINYLEKKKERESFFQEIKDGLSYAFSNSLLKTIIISLVVVNLAVTAQAVLMPIFVKQVLKGDARTLGVLMAALGLGSFLGALFLAGRRSALGLTSLISQAIFVMGLCFFVLSFNQSLVMACVYLFLIGFAALFLLTGSNTIFQLVVLENFRGRLMSIYSMTFIGLAPFGSLLGGLLASKFGMTATMIFLSLILVAVGFWAKIQVKKISPEEWGL